MTFSAIFFGTPDIAVPAFNALCTVANVKAAVCQPDRRSGRGMVLRAPPVKQAAERMGIPVHQPTKIKHDLAQWLADQHVDVAVVMAYGRILPRSVLDAPRIGCLNLHASLLPKLRGAAPINWAIVRGETTTGISLMQMDETMDTGPVLAQRTLPIGPDETAGNLADRLALLAAEMVTVEVQQALDSTLHATPQQHEHATYAPMLTKTDGEIDWNLPPNVIHNHVRGMNPWPGGFTTHRGQVLKIHSCEIYQAVTDNPPGTIVIADNTAVIVACKNGCVRLKSVQLAGKKPINAETMVSGRTLAQGEVLGQ